MSELPDPLVSADVDIRDFPYMPLDVVRLRDSDIATKAKGDEFRCAVLLWCAAWHQTPAASLPDDDDILSQYAGFGRVVREWKKIKAGALRGWIKCSDGRLYHPVVAEKANDAWRAKLEQRWRTECARIKKHMQRHSMSLSLPDFDSWMSQGCPQGHALPVPETQQGCPQGQPPSVPRETHSKRSEEKGRDLVNQETTLLSGKPDDALKPEKKKLSEACVEVLEFLNEKTGRNYKPVKANITLIAARLKEGATVIECRQVIAKKCREWRDDPQREIYLRPKTLFNATNFANYQGELVA